MVSQRRSTRVTDASVRRRPPSVTAEPTDTGRVTRDAASGVVDQFHPVSARARVALSAFGAWSDMDWEETREALDRIRHESTPTPPIDDL